MEEPPARPPKGVAMPEPTAQRTLVKSPPELWAEVSDAESLARHLGEFGEIRITRLEPESTVVWEGERARGTVQIEPSGWGTKVTLTATVPEVTPPEPVAVEPEPVAVEPEPEPEPEAEPEPEPEPEPELVSPPPPPSAAVMLERSGFFSRLFARSRTIDEIPEAPPAPEPEIAPPTPVPDPEPEPEPEPEEEPALPEPTPLPERDPDPMPPAAVEELLSDVLDSLGSAHHRPFSRH
jgi:hypothetical protein